MPTFSVPDSFKDHKQYVALLKKALLVVKPGVEKKFLYFHQYTFGAKKLPLVLVDYDAGCPAALAKAGLKPTAEGIVTLTEKEELNFDAKKGSLKRTRIRKYFGNMGPGLKEVFVPPDEVDEDEGAPSQTQEVAQAPAETPPAPPPTPQPAPKEDPSAKFTARFKALQPDIIKAIGTKTPQGDEVKKRATEAGTFAAKKDFDKANLVLDAVQDMVRKMSGVSTAFSEQWTAAKQAWRTASEAVDGQIAQLQAALKKSGDAELLEIAEFGLNGVAGNFKVPLMANILQVDRAQGDALKKASAKGRLVVANFRKHLDSDAAVKACDENPFSVKVSIRPTLGGALAKLEQALAAAAA